MFIELGYGVKQTDGSTKHGVMLVNTNSIKRIEVYEGKVLDVAGNEVDVPVKVFFNDESTLVTTENYNDLVDEMTKAGEVAYASA